MSFLAAWPAILERLSTRVPAAMAVVSQPDMDAIATDAHPRPCLHVLWDGYEPLESLHNGSARVQQRWTVVVDVRDAAGPSQVAQYAGEMADAVMSALLGWRPATGLHVMQIASSSEGPKIGESYCLLPLTFTTALAVTASPT